MESLRNSLNELVLYYKHLGLDGLFFCYKKKFKKNKLISIYFKEIGQSVYLRNNTSDILAFHDIFIDKEYNIKFSLVPKVIIDCGANIGLTAIYFKTKYPQAKIISIEPESSNFELLQKNTKGLPDVHSLNAAVWNKSTILEIEDVGLGNWGYITNEVKVESASTIKAVSLNEVIKQYNLDSIDVLKLDVEGSEKEIFQLNFNDWLSKVKVLIIELHDEMRNGCSESFYKAMENYDYKLFPHGNNLVCFITNQNLQKLP